MNIRPYLSFNGECEAAFTFYAQCLGGQMGPLFRYGGSPYATHAPADWQEKVMHASVVVGDQTLEGADVPPDRYEAPQGIAISLHIDATADAERIFDVLARGGRIVVPLEKTFWAARFGEVVDRFGIPWLINCEGSDEAAAA